MDERHEHSISFNFVQPSALQIVRLHSSPYLDAEKI